MKYKVRFLRIIIIIAAVLAFCIIVCFWRRAGYRDYSVDSSGSYLLYKGKKIGDVYGTDNPDYASKDDFPYVIYGVHSSNEKVVFLFEANGYKCYKVEVNIEPSAAETEEGNTQYEKKVFYELTNLQKAVGFELTDQRYYTKNFETFLKKTAEDM
ncbi:MAG: hypothetical protein PUJ25_04235 [Lachnospiraceae bacterium]|nr:hypothetical protein [Lachnospiraceae bacterium]MDD7664789.1 hypothetical protein [Lachnospiraceae bacterium]MDY4164967.1 hypothetical protein [Lachnospiraceae bacterium]